MNKKVIVIISIVCLALCVLNFVFVLSFSQCENIGLIATIISGWVSGIATLFVGIIAALQAKQYNDSNSEFIRKQFDLDKSKSILQSRLLFVDNLKKAWAVFCESAAPYRFCNDLYATNAITDTTQKNITVMNIIIEASIAISNSYLKLNNVIALDYSNIGKKKVVIDAIKSYRDEFIKHFKDRKNLNYYQSHVEELAKVLNGNFANQFNEITKLCNEYILNCDYDINYCIVNKSDDVDYLIKRFNPQNVMQNSKSE